MGFPISSSRDAKWESCHLLEVNIPGSDAAFTVQNNLIVMLEKYADFFFNTHLFVGLHVLTFLITTPSQTLQHLTFSDLMDASAPRYTLWFHLLASASLLYCTVQRD